MAKDKNKFFLTIGVIILVFISLYFIQYSNLNATVDLKTTPNWVFSHGCNNGECSGGSYNIGDFSMSSSTPIYDRFNPICRIDEKYINPSEVPNECFYVEFSFSDDLPFTQDDKIIINHLESIDLTPYLSVKYVASGLIINGESCHKEWYTDSKGNRKSNDICRNLDYEYDWQEPTMGSKYIFSVEEGFLKSKVNKIYNINVLQDQSAVDFTATNKLVRIDSGYILRQKSKLFSPEKTIFDERLRFNLGENKVTSEVSTFNLGDSDLEFNPFLIVINSENGRNSEVYLYGQNTIATTRTLPNIVFPWVDDSEDNQTEDLGDLEEENSNLYITVILVFILLGGLILYAQKKQR